MNARRQDIEAVLDNRPGSLADFGQVLGGAGVSLDGGGVFTHDAIAVAHFLVDDALIAREALQQAGIGPVRIRDVVMLYQYAEYARVAAEWNAARARRG